MKIVFINPPQPNLVNPGTQAPLGVLYLIAVLRNAGYQDVELLNLTAVDPDKVEFPEADIYGFTATSLDYHLCEQLSKQVKIQYPKAKILLGGAHATITHSLGMVNMQCFDSVCIGEAESIIVRMVEDVQNDTLLNRYFGEPIQPLDQLPFPARDVLEQQGGKIFGLGTQFSSNESTVIMGSRGCPFSCAFCASAAIWKTKNVRRRQPINIAAEIRHVKDAYGINEFRFSDDNLNLSRKWLHALCEKLKPLDIIWRGSVHAGFSTYEDYKIMYNAGCREICPGIESGDQRVLDTLRKGTTCEQNVQCINEASQAGINVRVLLITGAPGEYSNTPELTMEFLSNVNYHSLALKQFRPFPGSEIWAHPEEFGCRILDNDCAKQNFYFWGAAGETPIRSLVETDMMSAADLEDNMRRMHDYVKATKKDNRG